MHGRIIKFTMTLDDISAIGLDSNIALFLYFGNLTTWSCPAPLPTDYGTVELAEFSASRLKG
jgi:hypothetical protein